MNESIENSTEIISARNTVMFLDAVKQAREMRLGHSALNTLPYTNKPAKGSNSMLFGMVVCWYGFAIVSVTTR